MAMTAEVVGNGVVFTSTATDSTITLVGAASTFSLDVNDVTFYY
jgi:hypothetical protein